MTKVGVAVCCKLSRESHPVHLADTEALNSLIRDTALKQRVSVENHFSTNTAARSHDGNPFCSFRPLFRGIEVFNSDFDFA